MGLDISVNVTGQELWDALEDMGADERDKAIARAWLDDGDTRLQEKINTRTGSYGGLHILRRAYANMKGWPLVEGQMGAFYPGEESNGSHLCNHSDCDGWYLPDTFDPPTHNPSVGSGPRLREELRELMAVIDEKHEDYWRLIALYIPALACVYCRAPIDFH